MSSIPQSSPKPKSRLGRGLSSLISVSDLPVNADVAPPVITPGVAAPMAAPAPAAPASNEIPLDRIVPNPHQPRKEMSDASLAELAASLKSTGLIQPIVVRQVGPGYQLIAGERRFRAAKLAGLTSIPAIVRDVDSFTQAQMALVENIQREDLNPLDRALAYRSLMSQLGLSQSELAGRLGEDRTGIAHYLRLLELSEPVRELVRTRMLSLGHAKLLAGVSDPVEQQRLANLCIAQELSVRNLERLLADSKEATTTRERGPSAHLLDLEKSVARQLGMRTQIRAGKNGKGRLVIHYASLDQFDELMQRMGVRTE